jgi:outer membrane lipoprotein SlyB
MRALQIAAFMLVVTSTAYANQNVIVDTKGVDATQYHADMYECQQYAQQVSPEEVDSAGKSIVGSTARGALLGAAGSAIAGGSGSDGAKVGAGIGLVGGALHHRAEKNYASELSEEQKFEVTRNCMVHRGYTVLN